MKDEKADNLKPVGSNEMLAAAFKSADRCDFLCKNVPTCKCGEKEQIQLVNWICTPAQWRCRLCHKTWEYEPANDQADRCGFIASVSGVLL